MGLVTRTAGILLRSPLKTQSPNVFLKKKVKAPYDTVGLTSNSTHYRSLQRWFHGLYDPTNSVIALKNNG